MGKIKLTTENLISIAAEVLRDVYKEQNTTQDSSHSIPVFTKRLQNKIKDIEESIDPFRVCQKCKKKKPLSDFYYASGRKYRINMCSKCLKQKQKEKRLRSAMLYKAKERRQADIVKALSCARKVELTIEQQEEKDRLYKEKTRMAARNTYYDAERMYLLKKYYKRHKDFLQNNKANIEKLEKEKETSTGISRKRIEERLINAYAKRERLERIISLEEELINNPEKRKEVLNDGVYLVRDIHRKD